MNIRKYILVVDNDPASAKRIDNILRSEGYIISSASTPEQILSALKETNPSLIFVSLSMPDGLDICKRIHSMTAFSKIPIIALTSMEKGKAKYEPEYGIIDSINRSFGADELILKTETVLSIKEITESGPGAIVNKPQFKPFEEEDIFAIPEEEKPFPEKGIEPDTSSEEDFVPVHEDLEGLIDKSFESGKETPHEKPILAEEPMKKKRGLLVPVIVLIILIISAVAYFSYQRFGKEIRTTANQLVNKVLPSKPAQPVPTAKPATPTQPVQPLRPVEPQKPQAQGPKASSQAFPEIKIEQKPEAQKVIPEQLPKTASVKEVHFYSAQVGAYKEISNAEALIKILKNKGYDAFTISITNGNEKFHKVLVGKFQDKKKAQEIISDLREKENLKGIVYTLER